jgi:hypothetical protein
MMKLSPFLLVRTPTEELADQSARPRITRSRTSTGRTASKETMATKSALKRSRPMAHVASEPSALNENFKTTLNATLLKSRGNKGEAARTKLAKVVKDLKSSPNVQRVGILDLGAWLGKLPELIEQLNRAQVLYTLFELLAPVPGGLIKTEQGFVDWSRAHLDAPLDADVTKGLPRQMIREQFNEVAGNIQRGMGVDLLVGVTPALIAGVKGDEIFWNHFSSVMPPLVLLSVSDLRDFAGQAGRPYEAAVGLLLAVALLVAHNRNLRYHGDNGCVFDYKADRTGLVDTLRTMRICPACEQIMSTAENDALRGMLAALKAMRLRRSATTKGRAT